MKFGKAMLFVILAVGSVARAEVSELNGISKTLECRANTGISFKIEALDYGKNRTYHFKLSDNNVQNEAVEASAAGGPKEGSRCPCYEYAIVVGANKATLGFEVLSDGSLSSTLTAVTEFGSIQKDGSLPISCTLK